MKSLDDANSGQGRRELGRFVAVKLDDPGPDLPGLVENLFALGVHEDRDNLDAVPHGVGDLARLLDRDASRRTAPEVETDHVRARVGRGERVLHPGDAADLYLWAHLNAGSDACP